MPIQAPLIDANTLHQLLYVDLEPKENVANNYGTSVYTIDLLLAKYQFDPPYDNVTPMFVYVHSNSSYAIANAAFLTANAAYAQANIANANFTAANVLTLLETVDGSGSNLDADMVDGLHASSFANATFANAYFASATYANSTFASASYANTTIFVQANAAFTQANAANVLAQTAFNKANAANVLAQAAFDEANTANTEALAAFAQANAAFAYANSHFTTPNNLPFLDVTLSPYNAKHDGITDDTAAIQSAINAAQSVSQNTPLDNTKIVYLPSGTYNVTTLTVGSGVTLMGAGPATILKSGISNSQIIALGSNTWCVQVTIENLGFQITGANTWSIKANAADILNSNFRNLSFNVAFGIALTTYTQQCCIENLYSFGNLDQFIYLKGNDNTIKHIDKEGSTGSTIDPYIFIQSSIGNTIDDILIEGATSSNKEFIKLDACSDTKIDNIWIEPTSTSNVGMHINNCLQTWIGRFNNALLPGYALKIDTSQQTRVEVLDGDGGEEDVFDIVTLDNSSDLTIGLFRTRRGADVKQLSRLTKNLHIEHVFNRQIYIDAPTGYSPVDLSRWDQSQNLLMNGSFEAGNYGWTWDNPPTLNESYTTSEYSSGLMGNFSWSPVTSQSILRQAITVSANMIGLPITITALANVSNGAGWINPFSNGCGVVDSTSYQRAMVGKGKQLISRTVIPQSAGTINMGLEFISVNTATVDEVCISVTPYGKPYGSRFGSIELNGSTLTTGTAAPTTGTWKAGDIVVNSVPSSGSATLWRCIVAGSPGTWETVNGQLDLDWIPVLTFGGANVGMVQSTATASSRKSGGWVYVMGTIVLSAKGSSTGQAKISNLPYPVMADQKGVAPCSLLPLNVTYTGELIGYFNFGSSDIALAYETESGTFVTIDNTFFANNSQITFSGMYRTS